LPVTEIDKHKGFVKELIKKFEKQIALTHLCNRVILKYNDKFHDSDFNYLLDYEARGDKMIGNVKRNKLELNFVFIDADDKEYYANRYDFIDISTWIDWKNLKNGQLVGFEIGTNARGECARNIKIVN
jgi:cold shock CspA family protein